MSFPKKFSKQIFQAHKFVRESPSRRPCQNVTWGRNGGLIFESGPHLFWQYIIFVELNFLSRRSHLIPSTLTHSLVCPRKRQSEAGSNLLWWAAHISSCLMRKSVCANKSGVRDRKTADRSSEHLRGVSGCTSVSVTVLISKQGSFLLNPRGRIW